MRKESWRKVREKYLIGVFCFIALAIFGYFATTRHESKEIIYEDLLLKEDPVFQREWSSYWVDLTFEGKKEFRIEGIDYKYLKEKAFKISVVKGNTFTVGRIDKAIVSLQYGAYEYLQFERAQIHKQKNSEFVLKLLLTGAFFCLIPLFFRKRPVVHLKGGKSFTIPFALILILALAVALIYLSHTIGFKYASSDEFIP